MMPQTTQVLVPALREAREAEAAVADRLRAHAVVTPAGDDRMALERRIGEARTHIRRLDEHMNALQPPGLTQILGDAWHLTRQAARLPLNTAMAVPAAVRSRTAAAQRQLLRHTEEEYAVTAYALAASRAGEQIARTAGDTAGSRLLGSIHREDRDLLEELDRALLAHADALATGAGTAGGR